MSDKPLMPKATAAWLINNTTLTFDQIAEFCGLHPLEVQAIAETVPGYEASALFGMGAPKNSPKDIIERLNSEINAVMAEPEMTKRLVELGGAPLIQSPGAFGDMIEAETAKWKKVVEFAGLKVE